MRMKQRGEGRLELFLLGSSWYGAVPDPQFSPATKLSPVGNEFFGPNLEGGSSTDRAFFTEAPTDATLAKISRALDDLRHLGETDMRLNHPHQIQP